jgi:hypothetical protein
VTLQVADRHTAPAVGGADQGGEYELHGGFFVGEPRWRPAWRSSVVSWVIVSCAAARVGAAASRHVLAALVGADETDPGTMDWSAEATIPVWSEEEGEGKTGTQTGRTLRLPPRLPDWVPVTVCAP